MDLLKQSSGTREDLGMLALTDALAEKEEVTQRQLSQKTGLNLKKVNYCLHKLLEKGHVKFQRALSNPDKRSYLYILTPSGLKAKSQLTYGFLEFTLGFYNQVEQKLRHCLARMEQAGVKRVLLCGASEAARIVLGLVQGNGIVVVGVLERAPGAAEFEGYPILDIADTESVEWDRVLITALDDLQGVEAWLRESGIIAEPRIWRLS